MMNTAGPQTTSSILKADVMRNASIYGEDKEPEIYHAIRPGALVENVQFFAGTDHINFNDGSITENTRVSYPLHYISNSVEPSIGNTPKNIFFLTCDAYGVLPPISKLSPGQAMYQFISGYTAKVAGTETGITEPKSTFSACFGAPFLPLHPTKYADMLGNKMKKHDVKVWLVKHRLVWRPLPCRQTDGHCTYSRWRSVLPLVAQSRPRGL